MGVNRIGQQTYMCAHGRSKATGQTLCGGGMGGGSDFTDGVTNQHEPRSSVATHFNPATAAKRLLPRPSPCLNLVRVN